MLTVKRVAAFERGLSNGTASNGDFGVVTPEEIMARGGLDFLKDMISGRLPQAPMCATLGFRLAEAEQGFAAFEGNPAEWMYNPLGTVHGGWTATLLDSALGCAVHSALPAGSSYTTATLEVKFVRAITATTGRVRAEGRVVHAGGRIATAEARLIAVESGKLLATATTTCAVLS